MTNFKDIEIPEEYQEKSRQITMLWEAFIDNGENLDRLIVETRTLLINAGMGATEAMQKIAKDHRHLKGFSLRSLYRILPQEVKQKQVHSVGEKRLPNGNDFEIPQTKPNIIDVEPDRIIENAEEVLQKAEEITREQETEQQALAPYTATDDRLKLQQELELTQQLLKEERAKTTQLEERIELMQREHEATVAQLQDKNTDLDALTDKLSAQLQEKSRQLTSLTLQQDNAIPEPPTEQNYTIEADIAYNSKKLPVVVRCFISGSKVGWIDRDLYKARYGKEPIEE